MSSEMIDPTSVVRLRYEQYLDEQIRSHDHAISDVCQPECPAPMAYEAFEDSLTTEIRLERDRILTAMLMAAAERAPI